MGLVLSNPNTTMKLTNQQIKAIALSFIEPAREAHAREDARRDQEARIKWDKTADGKTFAKLPTWMRDVIKDSYRSKMKEDISSLRDKSPMPPKPSYDAVEQQVIIATIGAETVNDITAHLKRHFKA